MSVVGAELRRLRRFEDPLTNAAETTLFLIVSVDVVQIWLCELMFAFYVQAWYFLSFYLYDPVIIVNVAATAAAEVAAFQGRHGCVQGVVGRVSTSFIVSDATLEPQEP